MNDIDFRSHITRKPAIFNMEVTPKHLGNDANELSEIKHDGDNCKNVRNILGNYDNKYDLFQLGLKEYENEQNQDFCNKLCDSEEDWELPNLGSDTTGSEVSDFDESALFDSEDEINTHDNEYQCYLGDGSGEFSQTYSDMQRTERCQSNGANLAVLGVIIKTEKSNVEPMVEDCYLHDNSCLTSPVEKHDNDDSGIYVINNSLCENYDEQLGLKAYVQGKSVSTSTNSLDISSVIRSNEFPDTHHPCCFSKSCAENEPVETCYQDIDKIDEIEKHNIRVKGYHEKDKNDAISNSLADCDKNSDCNINGEFNKVNTNNDQEYDNTKIHGFHEQITSNHELQKDNWHVVPFDSKNRNSSQDMVNSINKLSSSQLDCNNYNNDECPSQCTDSQKAKEDLSCNNSNNNNLIHESRSTEIEAKYDYLRELSDISDSEDATDTVFLTCKHDMNGYNYCYNNEMQIGENKRSNIRSGDLNSISSNICISGDKDQRDNTNMSYAMMFSSESHNSCPLDPYSLSNCSVKKSECGTNSNTDLPNVSYDTNWTKTRTVIRRSKSLDIILKSHKQSISESNKVDFSSIVRTKQQESLSLYLAKPLKFCSRTKRLDLSPSSRECKMLCYDLTFEPVFRNNLCKSDPDLSRSVRIIESDSFEESNKRIEDQQMSSMNHFSDTCDCGIKFTLESENKITVIDNSCGSNCRDMLNSVSDSHIQENRPSGYELSDNSDCESEIISNSRYSRFTITNLEQSCHNDDDSSMSVAKHISTKTISFSESDSSFIAETKMEHSQSVSCDIEYNYLDNDDLDVSLNSQISEISICDHKERYSRFESFIEKERTHSHDIEKDSFNSIDDNNQEKNTDSKLEESEQCEFHFESSSEDESIDNSIAKETNISEEKVCQNNKCRIYSVYADDNSVENKLNYDSISADDYDIRSTSTNISATKSASDTFGQWTDQHSNEVDKLEPFEPENITSECPRKKTKTNRQNTKVKKLKPKLKNKHKFSSNPPKIKIKMSKNTKCGISRKYSKPVQKLKPNTDQEHKLFSSGEHNGNNSKKLQENNSKINSGEKLFSCFKCSMKFTSQTLLKAHKLVHSDTKPFKCEYCYKTFTRSAHLKYHYLIHSGEKNYVCEICCESFTNEDSLKNHMTHHTGEKPYICSECGKCFRILSSLKSHFITRHSDARNFECTLCQKKFKLRTHLDIHLKRHSGEKEHECLQCGKLFLLKQDLVKHTITHCKKRLFCCDKCGSDFIFERNLRCHQMAVHEQKEFLKEDSKNRNDKDLTENSTQIAYDNQPPCKTDNCANIINKSSDYVSDHCYKPRCTVKSETIAEFDLSLEDIYHNTSASESYSDAESGFQEGESSSECKSEYCEVEYQIIDKDSQGEFKIDKYHSVGHVNTAPVLLETDKGSKVGKEIVEKRDIRIIALPVKSGNASSDESKKKGEEIVEITSNQTNYVIDGHKLTQNLTSEKNGKHNNIENVKEQYETDINCVPNEQKQKNYRDDSISKKNVTQMEEQNSKKKPSILKKRKKCSFCGKKFKQTGHYNVHLRIHTGVKPYECQVCKRRFTIRQTLDQHIRVHSGEKPYSCEICEKVFRTTNQLKSHKLTHSKERPYKCDYCNKTYKERSYLKYHNLIHSGEKNFHCYLCDKTFTHKFTLNCHMRTHTKEKPYTCLECNRCFSLLHTLKSHIVNRHTEAKPFQCSICDYSCKQKGTLDQHVSRHAGEKVHQCIECEKQFAEKRTLVKHMKVHMTSNQPKIYECDHCNVSFLFQRNLIIHKKALHLENMDSSGDKKATSIVDIDFANTENHTHVRPCKVKLTDILSQSDRELYLSGKETFSKTVGHKICTELKDINSSQEERVHQNGKFNVTRENDKPVVKREIEGCPSNYRQNEDIENKKEEEHVEAGNKNLLEIHTQKNGSTNIKEHKILIKPDINNAKPYVCSICNKCFSRGDHLETHYRVHTKVKPFSCKDCGKSFAHKQSLVGHLRIHTGEKPYECHICKKSFRLRELLKTHELTHSKTKPFKCHCGKRFSQQSHLKIHFLVHSGEAKNKCEKCDRRFVYRIDINRHMKWHNGIKPYTCMDCNKAFYTGQELKCHLKWRHTSERPFACQHCSKRFKQKVHLNTHLQIHEGNKKLYPCMSCDKKYNTEAKRKLHTRIHSGERPHKCDHCSLSFMFSYNLKNHVKRVHLQIEKKKSQCIVCNKYVTNLKKHMMTHTKEKPFACQHCDFRSSEKSGLKIHNFTHTGEKPFSCLYCGKSFRHRSSLTTHIFCHTGEKPFECSTCGYRCCDQSSLIKHYRGHTGEKKFACGFEGCDRMFKTGSERNVHKKLHVKLFCPFCNELFNMTKALKMHIATHQGEKPYKCPICNKGFGTKGSLKLHEASHIDEKKIKCEECNMRFTTIDNYKKHFKNRHSETPIQKNIVCNIKGCQTKFQHPSGLKVHQLKVHSNERHFSCTVCNKKFKDTSGVQLHMRTHTGYQPFECKICGKTFTQSSNLKTHQVSHGDEKNFKCQVCGVSFKTKHVLKSHIKNMHEESEKYECDICNNFFKSKSTLHSHKKKHGERTIYSCMHCDKTFLSKDGLTYHLRNHTGEKPFKCTYPGCNSAFASKTLLKTHTVVHTGERNFPCPDCGKRFTQNSHMRTHQKLVHLGIKKPPPKPENLKKLYCPECNKGFTRSNGLKYHMMTHSGEKVEKPYSCHYCDLKCRSSGTLKSHLRTHTKERPYKCEQCSDTFSRRDYLNLHILKDHADDGKKPFPCEVEGCERAFFLIGELKRHMNYYHPDV